ncbi:hypothetical protein ABIA45_007439 [Bradyrhizobium sp. USDA 336]
MVQPLRYQHHALPSHARRFTLSWACCGTRRRRRNMGSRAVLRSPAPSVCTGLRKSTGWAASTTLRSDRRAITGCLEAPIAPAKASPIPPSARPGCAPVHLDFDHSTDLGRWRGDLHGLRLYRRNALGLATPLHRSRRQFGRHEVLGFAGRARRYLASPHREQSAGNAIAPRHLGDVRPLLKALRHDPGLLLARPPSPALPSDHLNAAIRVTFLPGIKHGICHRATPSISFVSLYRRQASSLRGEALMPVTLDHRTRRQPLPVRVVEMTAFWRAGASFRNMMYTTTPSVPCTVACGARSSRSSAAFSNVDAALKLLYRGELPSWVIQLRPIELSHCAPVFLGLVIIRLICAIGAAQRETNFSSSCQSASSQ